MEMIIRWPWVLVAVVLLAPPPILSSDLRRVLTSARRNASLRAVSLVRAWQNWLDLIRASLGTLVVTELAFLPDPTKDSVAKPSSLGFTMLAVAVLFQVIRVDTRASRLEQKLQLLGPIFYLCGITWVASGLSGAFAVFVGWIFAVGSKNPAYQLPAMGIALVVGGYVFGLSLPLMCNVALIMMPYWGAFVLRKRLVFVGSERRFSSPVLKPT